jgi:hypothetical protein
MGLKNPQTDKKFVKPAYGFAAGFKGKSGSRR